MLNTLSQRILTAFIMALTLTLIFMVLGQGQGTVAGGGLPPRPTPTAVPAVPVNGATVRLHTSASMPGAWTIIEWQNELGDWYEVAGWRGHLDDGNADMKAWWVYPTNYGEGPFRWLVYTGQNGDLLAVSEPFDLPNHNHQVVSVEIEIP
jgi:hypothetical protein